MPRSCVWYDTVLPAKISLQLDCVEERILNTVCVWKKDDGCRLHQTHSLTCITLGYNIMVSIFGKFRRNKQEKASSAEGEKLDDSFGETIPTKDQFFMELPVKRELEPVESLLLSLGASIQTDGIRSASTISSLSSNSASTCDLPRRQRDADAADPYEKHLASKGPSSPLAWFAPSLFEEEAAPPLKNAKHVPSFWQTWLSCCAHDAVVDDSVAPTEISLFGFFGSDDEGDEAEASNKVAKKRGGFNVWRARLLTSKTSG